MATLFGCKATVFPADYLGLLLGGNPRLDSFLKLVNMRCPKKVAMWKANYLSFGGRLTLIKATMNNLPIYYLSLFRAPKGVVQEIKTLQ